MIELVYTLIGFFSLMYIGEWFKNFWEDIRNESP